MNVVQILQRRGRVREQLIHIRTTVASVVPTRRGALNSINALSSVLSRAPAASFVTSSGPR